ncbi:MAG: AMP-binding protein [Clostridia bacterium]|nr:AMP-binding protein [Clostridia bacterium]
MKNKYYPYYHDVDIFTLRDFINYCTEKHSTKTAYSYEVKKELIKKTFVDFSNDIKTFGAYIADKYPSKSKIAVLGENSYEWIVSYFSATNSGNVIVPLDKNLPVKDVENILNETEASLLICSDTYRDYAEQIQADKIKIDIIFVSEIFKSVFPKVTDKMIEKFENINISPDDLCSIIYTSGTTGMSKGVMLTHKNLCVNLKGGITSLKAHGKTVLVLPLHHAYGFFANVLFAMFWGVENYINTSLKNMALDIQKIKPDVLFAVPMMAETFYNRIWNAINEKKKDKIVPILIRISNGLLKLGVDIRRKLFKEVVNGLGGNLSLVVCGGAALDIKYHQFFESIGVHIAIGYGITECSPIISVNLNDLFKYNSAGLPLSCSTIKIENEEGKREGEILVKGDMVMKGYYKQPQLTAEVMEGEYFRTGDIGYQDEDGFIFITGRKKNMIVLSNGKNVYPEELEFELLKNNAIKEVVVFESDKEIAAEIYPDSQKLADLSIKDAQKYFEEYVTEFNKTQPMYKNINKVVLRDTEFPKTTSMKIKRNYN